MSLWWDFVHERADTWTLADYRLAARLLGQLAARRQAGAQVNEALPAVARNAHDGGSALRFYASRRVFGGMLPVLQSGQVWQHPVLQEALRLTGDQQLPANMSRSEPACRRSSTCSMICRRPTRTATRARRTCCSRRRARNYRRHRLGLRHAAPRRIRPWPAAGRPRARRPDRPGRDLGHRRGDLPGLPGRTGGRGLQGRSGASPAGYLGSLAARSALCAIPFEALENAVPGQQTAAMFAGRMELTRLMLDMTAETIGP